MNTHARPSIIPGREAEAPVAPGSTVLTRLGRKHLLAQLSRLHDGELRIAMPIRSPFCTRCVATSAPVDLSSKNAISSRCTCPYASSRNSCCTVCANPRQRTYGFFAAVATLTALADLPAAMAAQTGRLDDMVRRILRSMFANALIDRPVAIAPIDVAANTAVAQDAAEKGAVLLRNARGTLPLRAGSLREGWARAWDRRTDPREAWPAIEADAKAVAEAGAFAVVLEGMAEPLAAPVT